MWLSTFGGLSISACRWSRYRSLLKGVGLWVHSGRYLCRMACVLLYHVFTVAYLSLTLANAVLNEHVYCACQHQYGGCACKSPAKILLPQRSRIRRTLYCMLVAEYNALYKYQPHQHDGYIYCSILCSKSSDTPYKFAPIIRVNTACSNA